MIAAIVTASCLASGWLFMRQGLLAAAMMLFSVFIGAAAGLAFGPGVAELLGARSSTHYALIVILLGVVSCGVIRALLVPLNDDVDFHPLADRIGGCVLGAATAAVIAGFLCAGLLCMNLGVLSRAEAGLRRGAGLVLAPCAAVSRLVPGRYPLELQTLIDRTPPVGDEPADGEAREPLGGPGSN